MLLQWIVDLDDNIEEYKIFKKKETKTLKSLINVCKFR